jgi:hypothetical protein
MMVHMVNEVRGLRGQWVTKLGILWVMGLSSYVLLDKWNISGHDISGKVGQWLEGPSG